MTFLSNRTYAELQSLRYKLFLIQSFSNLNSLIKNKLCLELKALRKSYLKMFHVKHLLLCLLVIIMFHVKHSRCCGFVVWEYHDEGVVIIKA